MRRIGAFAVLACSVLALPAIAHEERRQMGKHEHGQGVLNIAIEGSKVEMSLEAPGSDIVGFEHAAKTEEQKAAIEAAKAKLKAASSLFELSAAANCTLATSSVALTSEDHAHHDHEGHDEHETHEGHDHNHSDDAHNEESHSEFHAKYTYACEDVAKLGDIQFGYFEVFKGALELDVTVVSDKGSAVFEVKRDTPTLKLDGRV